MMNAKAATFEVPLATVIADVPVAAVEENFILLKNITLTNVK